MITSRGAGPLPGALRGQVEDVLGPISSITPVSGGCVSTAVRAVTRNGPIFLKFETHASTSDFFLVEAGGLEALARAGTRIRIPEVIGNDSSEAGSWLALEWLQQARPLESVSAELGRGLAELHRHVGEGWGWPRDGFIGKLTQSNRHRSTWAEFWYDERLAPQLRLAGSVEGIGTERDWTRLRERLSVLLEAGDQDGPSLLHGDLWSGNVMGLEDGPALVDPACYHGHREVDLAMAALFGGFGRDFDEAYQSVWPLAPGHEVRRAIYQLYYLLVHVNLFGRSYVRATSRALATALAA